MVLQGVGDKVLVFSILFIFLAFYIIGIYVYINCDEEEEFIVASILFFVTLLFVIGISLMLLSKL